MLVGIPGIVYSGAALAGWKEQRKFGPGGLRVFCAEEEAEWATGDDVGVGLEVGLRALLTGCALANHKG